MNLELHNAYKNYLILREIITMFHDKIKNSDLFKNLVEYFKNED